MNPADHPWYARIISMLVMVTVGAIGLWWLWLYMVGWPMPPDHVRNPTPPAAVRDLPIGAPFFTVGRLSARTGPAHTDADLIVYYEYLADDGGEEVERRITPPIILETDRGPTMFADDNYRIRYVAYHGKSERSNFVAPRGLKGFRSGDTVGLEGRIRDDGSIDIQQIVEGPADLHIHATRWDRWWTALLVWIARIVLTVPALWFVIEGVKLILPAKKPRLNPIPRPNTPEEDARLDALRPEDDLPPRPDRDPKDGSVPRGSER